MRSLPLGLAVLFSLGVVGCSTETSGLLEDDYGDASIDWDALNDDASAEVEGDAAEDSLTDSGTDAKDSTVVDSAGDAKSDVTALDVAVDSSVPDVASDTTDSGTTLDADAATADTGTAPTDTGNAPTDTGTAPTDTGTAPTDTGTLALAPNTGKVVCGNTTCNARPDWCCGRARWDFSGYDWTCEDTYCAQRDFICDEKADCTSGNKCCAIYPFGGSEIRGSECKSDCGSNAQLCMTNAECAPKTCVARKVPDGPQTIGVCQ